MTLNELIVLDTELKSINDVPEERIIHCEDNIYSRMLFLTYLFNKTIIENRKHKLIMVLDDLNIFNQKINNEGYEKFKKLNALNPQYQKLLDTWKNLVNNFYSTLENYLKTVGFITIFIPESIKDSETYIEDLFIGSKRGSEVRTLEDEIAKNMPVTILCYPGNESYIVKDHQASIYFYHNSEGVFAYLEQILQKNSTGLRGF